jgi:two-component system sensor histidine kinase KdpD
LRASAELRPIGVVMSTESPDMVSPRRYRGRDIWLVGLLVLLAATAGLYMVRGSLQQAHVVLVYLLIVLAASAVGGRTIGFVFAVLSFVAIDYFFQTPFDRFSVGNAVDWFVLGAFLLTATLAASLLAQAQAAADRAAHRTREVARLSRLGAELLGTGTAEQALTAIAKKVRDATQAGRCIVFRSREPGLPTVLDPLVTIGAELGDVTTDTVKAARALSTGVTVANYVGDPVFGPHGGNGSTSVSSGDGNGRVQSLAIPLRVHDRTVGVLALSSSETLAHDDASQRLLEVLTYYAAIAVERVSILAQLEHAEAAQESAKVREALLTSVSHDLRTPLTSIKLLAQEMIARRDYDVAMANGRLIEEQAERLNNLVGNLLDLTRLRSAAFPVHMDVNAADDLIGAVARQVSGILGDHPLERSIDEKGPVLLVQCDFVQTQRILVNLVENAVRYAPPGTPVALTVWRSEAWLNFSVSDLGPGIAPSERARVFEPFYRGPSASADSGGVGLGLYIGRALAEAQGGQLVLASSSSGGTTFILSLHAVDAPTDLPSVVDADTDVDAGDVAEEPNPAPDAVEIDAAAAGGPSGQSDCSLCRIFMSCSRALATSSITPNLSARNRVAPGQVRVSLKSSGAARSGEANYSMNTPGDATPSNWERTRS